MIDTDVRFYPVVTGNTEEQVKNEILTGKHIFTFFIDSFPRKIACRKKTLSLKEYFENFSVIDNVSFEYKTEDRNRNIVKVDSVKFSPEKNILTSHINNNFYDLNKFVNGKPLLLGTSATFEVHFSTLTNEIEIKNWKIKKNNTYYDSLELNEENLQEVLDEVLTFYIEEKPFFAKVDYENIIETIKNSKGFVYPIYHTACLTKFFIDDKEYTHKTSNILETLENWECPEFITTNKQYEEFNLTKKTLVKLKVFYDYKEFYLIYNRETKELTHYKGELGTIWY